MIPAQRGRLLCSCRQWQWQWQWPQTTAQSSAPASMPAVLPRRSFSRTAAASSEVNANTSKPSDNAHLQNSESNTTQTQAQSQQSSSFPTQSLWNTRGRSSAPKTNSFKLDEVSTLLNDLGYASKSKGSARGFQDANPSGSDGNGGDTGGSGLPTRQLTAQLNVNQSSQQRFRSPNAASRMQKNRKYKNLHPSPSLGRSVEVETSINSVGSDKSRMTGAEGRAAMMSAFARAQSQDLTKAFRMFEIQCSMNKVKQQQREQKFHVRRSQKKKELRMRRFSVDDILRTLRMAELLSSTCGQRIK